MNQIITIQLIILGVVLLASCVLLFKTKTISKHLRFLDDYEKNYDESKNIEIPPDTIAQYIAELIPEVFVPKSILHTEIEATSIIKKAWINNGDNWNSVDIEKVDHNFVKIKYYVKEHDLFVYASNSKEKKFWNAKIDKEGNAEINVLHKNEKKNTTISISQN